MKSADAIKLATQIAASCDTKLGGLKSCHSAGAGANAHIWYLVFAMVDGPSGWLWAFALNDLGQPQTWIAHRAQRRRSFSLRALMLAVTLVACWLGYQVHWIDQRRKAIEQELTLPSHFSGQAPPRAAPILLRLFGESGYWVLVPRHFPVSKSDVSRWEAMFPEAVILDHDP